MNYGLYTAFLGMRARQRTLEVQANNIANATTAGFKAERLNYGTIGAGTKAAGDKQNLIAAASTSGAADLSAGTISETGRGLDIAIEGDAFFQIQTPGGPRYTRAGNLTIDAAGQLVTQRGDLVVGSNGAITMPQGGSLSIGSDGSLAMDGRQFDTLKLVRFDNPTAALMKEGDSMFIATGAEAPKEAATSKVVQGALEGSNVNAITEMVAMINNNREFDSLQKSMSLMMNDLGRKISGEIGKM